MFPDGSKKLYGNNSKKVQFLAHGNPSDWLMVM